MKRWLRASGWNRSYYLSPTASQLDALGASLNILTAFGEEISLHQAQIVLAIGVLARQGQWVDLKSVKAKTPHIGDSQFSRHIRSLQGKGGLINLFQKNSPLISLRESPSNGRQKEICITDFGNLVLHRTLQSLQTSIPVSDLGLTSDDKPSCRISVSGEAVDGNIDIETPLLISTGIRHSGIEEQGKMLALQAIAQGAVVYWIEISGLTRIVRDLYSIADNHLRSHVCYVNGSDRQNGLKDIPIEEVILRDGVCVDLIDLLALGHLQSISKLKEILTELLAATDKNAEGKKADIYIVINCLWSWSKFDSKEIRQILSKMKAQIHIIEECNSEVDYNDYYSMGFAHLNFSDSSGQEGNEQYEHTISIDKRIDKAGLATLRTPDGNTSPLIKLDWVDVHETEYVVLANKRSKKKTI
ncbi:MAG: hypothetical protein ACJAS1_000835 [Oleiphilaceae bacterium]|jgi:hypothetical protein